MKIIVCKNQEEIASLVSDRIIDLVKSKPNCILGLATGSSPVETYKDVIIKGKNVDFSNVKSFNLDEYCNNKDFSQSYRYFMNHNLFDGINIKKENTFFPNENNPSQYDIDIEKSGGIDLQILGIGANGHIGFNEPNTPFDSITHITKLTEKTIKDNSRFFKNIEDVPTSAVSMGIKTILKAKEIILIAIGENKAEAIKKSLEEININCPASSLLQHNNVTFYLDEAAASLIKVNA